MDGQGAQREAGSLPVVTVSVALQELQELGAERLGGRQWGCSKGGWR